MTERFVSLYGAFSFDYPKHWKSEVDEAGNYVFVDEQQGAGAFRINVIQNPDTEPGNDQRYLEAVKKEQQGAGADFITLGTNRFVYLEKEHLVENATFLVHYWLAAEQSRIILFTYTVQENMKADENVKKEKGEIEKIVLSSLTFIEEDGQHSHH